MHFRKLRIAWLVGWGLLAVLLCALWVRSYRTMDSIRGVIDSYRIELQSWKGGLRGIVTKSQPQNQKKWRWSETPSAAWERSLQVAEGWGPLTPTPSFVSIQIRSTQWLIWAPHWFLALMSATVAVIPLVRHLRWRFSLRTLLIATTLIAVVLGLVVWAVR